MAKQGEGSRPAPLAHDAASQAPLAQPAGGPGRGRWGHLLACHASPGPVMQTKTRAGFFVAPRCEASQNLSMLKIRIIPCLDVKDGRVVKGINFVDLKDAGDPVEAAAAYDAAGADELCFLDIAASHEHRDTIFEIVERTASRCFMPLTVGGGVRSSADIRKLLRAGADKVSINTAAVNRRELVAEAADKFGAQCIVVAIDARRVAHPPRGAALGDLHPWRPEPDGARCRCLCPRGRGAGCR